MLKIEQEYPKDPLAKFMISNMRKVRSNKKEKTNAEKQLLQCSPKESKSILRTL